MIDYIANAQKPTLTVTYSIISHTFLDVSKEMVPYGQH
jgi:hypothetical protein